MVEHIARRVKINMFSVLVGKAKRKTLFGKQSYEGEDNIEMDLNEI